MAFLYLPYDRNKPKYNPGEYVYWSADGQVKICIQTALRGEDPRSWNNVKWRNAFGGSFTQVQSDWTQADPTAASYILNKPTLALVATTGNYDDLVTYAVADGVTITGDGTAGNPFTATAAAVGITSINALVAVAQFLVTGTSGTDFNIVSAAATHTFNLPVASAVNTGKLSNTDWSTFNSKVGGSGALPRVAVWSGAGTITSFADYFYDNANSLFEVGFGGNVLFDLNGATDRYRIGDLDATGNNSYIDIDDANQQIRIRAGGGAILSLQGAAEHAHFELGGAHFLHAIWGATRQIELGDPSNGNGSALLYDDVNQLLQFSSGVAAARYFLLDVVNGTYQLGDIDSAANNNTLTLDDTNNIFSVSSAVYSLLVNGTGIYTISVNTGNSFIHGNESLDVFTLQQTGTEIIAYNGGTAGDKTLEIGDVNATLNGTTILINDDNQEYTLNKLATGGVDEMVVADTNGVLSTQAIPSSSGTVNSGTQYQLAYYAANGTAVSGLTLITASRALVSDANGLPIAATTTATEIGYVNGVTSSIQTQIDNRAWVLVATATASGSATIDFTGLDGTYRNYVVFFDEVVAATDGDAFHARIGTGGTPTYQSGATDYAWMRSGSVLTGTTTTVATFLFGDGNDSQIVLFGAAMSSNANNAASGFMYIYDPAQTGSYHITKTFLSLRNNSSNTGASIIDGWYLSTTAVTAIRLFMSTGNVASGEFKLYGIK